MKRRLPLRRLILFFLFAGSVFTACTKRLTETSTEKEVAIIHVSNDPKALNPYMLSNENELIVIQNLYQSLLRIDPQTGLLSPLLAKSRPQLTITDSSSIYTYEIRDEARWDDGSPITAMDVDFSLKLIKNPYVNCKGMRGYLSYITDVKRYPENPKKISLVCGPYFVLGEATSGDFDVLQKAFYDTADVMMPFSVKELSIFNTDSSENETLKEFAAFFNSYDFKRNPGKLSGSGPYFIEALIENQEVVLGRKKNWWGDQSNSKSVIFQAFPEYLILKVIPDFNTALLSVKKGEIDLIKGIPADNYVQLIADSTVKQTFQIENPELLGYFYLGLNTQLPKFSSKATRQALAHLVDKKKIITLVHRGYAIPAQGPVLPSQKAYFNKSIIPYPFDVEKAKKILADDGWKDRNSDGILEKSIKGEEVMFTVDFLYHAGNEERKKIGIILQENFAKAGIKLEFITLDWALFQEKLREKEFEMFVGGRTVNPIADDPEPTFSTRNIIGGGNYTSFGDQVSDKIISDMRTAAEKDRIKLSKQLQQILHDDASCIFLYHPQERMLVNRKFTNVIVSPIAPRFWAASLKRKKSR